MTDSTDYLVHIHDRDVAHLIDGYLERRRDDVILARNALKQGDYEGLALLGHNLHGSGGAYGIPQLSRIGQDLERAARSEEAAGIEALIAQLDQLLDRVRIV
jgi:HPt (histidine-containing phosphotransfer) domain-containing protein